MAADAKQDDATGKWINTTFIYIQDILICIYTGSNAFRFLFARKESASTTSSVSGHKATTLACATKTVTDHVHHTDYVHKQVTCTPTVVFVPADATPTPSSGGKGNHGSHGKHKTTTTTTTKHKTATKTSSHSTKTPTPTSVHGSSLTHHDHSEDDDKKHSSGDRSPASSKTTTTSNDDDISAFTETGAPSTPTGTLQDPNADSSGNGDSDNSSSGDGSTTDGDSGTNTDGSSGDATNGTDGDDSSTSEGSNGDTTGDDTNDGSSDGSVDDGSSSSADNGASDGDNDASSSTDNNTNNAPSSDSNDQPDNSDQAANSPTNRVSETQAVQGSMANKSLGIGLGVGIGCVAAIGLAGLLVANKRRRNSAATSSNEYSDEPGPDTRWRPQSFMGVVASVVAKLPRSTSLRSMRSMRSQGRSTASQEPAGMAVGAGHGAIEDPQVAALGRHPSNSSTRSAASQPPSLARVREEDMHEVDLRY